MVAPPASAAAPVDLQRRQQRHSRRLNAFMREQGKKAASGAIDKETEEVLIHVIRKHPRFTDVFYGPDR